MVRPLAQTSDFGKDKAGLYRMYRRVSRSSIDKQAKTEVRAALATTIDAVETWLPNCGEPTGWTDSTNFADDVQSLYRTIRKLRLAISPDDPDDEITNAVKILTATAATLLSLEVEICETK